MHALGCALLLSVHEQRGGWQGNEARCKEAALRARSPSQGSVGAPRPCGALRFAGPGGRAGGEARGGELVALPLLACWAGAWAPEVNAGEAGWLGCSASRAGPAVRGVAAASRVEGGRAEGASGAAVARSRVGRGVLPMEC